MEGGRKKSVFASFFGWPEDRELIGKMRFGASYSTNNMLLLIARHILTTGLKKYFQSWQGKIRKFTVTAFHCQWKKYAPEVKAAKGLKRYQGS